MAKYYDQHTINVFCELATKEQIANAFNQALKELRNTTGQELPCTFDINLVKTESNRNYAYIYLSSVPCYHAFCGRNLDGSSRTIRQEVQKDAPLPARWGDIEEEEEIKLEPLVRLPPVSYTAQQQELSGYPDTELLYSPAYVMERPGYESNVLCGYPTAAGWKSEQLIKHVDLRRLRTLFEKYSDKTKFDIQTTPQGRIIIRYPDWNRQAALFALNMLRQFEMQTKEVKIKLNFKQQPKRH